MTTRIQNPEESWAITALSNAWDVVHYAVQDERGVQHGQRSVWYLSNHDAEEVAEMQATLVIGYGPRRCISALEQLNDARDLLANIRAQEQP